MSSSSSSSSAAFAFAPPPDHHHHLSSSPPTEQLCYVQCDFCHTVLAVCVPCTSLFKTVTVRCGHCTNLLSVNMRALLLPSPNHLFGPQNLLQQQEEIKNSPSNLVMQQQQNSNDSFLPVREMDVELPKVQAAAKRPPEKRQRVPSAYNRFIKDEIQRIKAGNPDISHREAFSAAAKNWAHFPHIHFGLMATDQPLKKQNVLQQYHQEVAAVAEGDEVHQHQHHVNVHVMKDGAAGFLGPPNVGLSPY